MKKLHKLIWLAFVLLFLVGCGTTPSAEPPADRQTSPPQAAALATQPSPTATSIPLPPAPTATQQPPAPTVRDTASPSATPTHESLPTVTPRPQLVSAGEPPGQVEITILYDNAAYEPALAAEWGFAAWIEYGDQTVLFDTGPSGAELLGNMAQLSLDPLAIDAVVLSHVHGDHTGGLLALLDTGARPVVYVPAAFPEPFKRTIAERTELVEVGAPIELLPGLYSTGEMGAEIIEQALVIESSQGAVVVTGCAHPGIVAIVRRARGLVPGEIELVLGGFHLVDTHSTKIDEIIAAFRDDGVKRLSPTHCTGETAIRKFAEAYGDDYVEVGAGRVLIVGEDAATELEGAQEASGVSALADVIAGLEDLPLEEFFDESSKQLLLRDPETVTALGLAEALGLRNDQLNNLSDAYLRETQQLEAAILELLRGYDREALSPEEQISYDVYAWHLDNLVRGHRFMYHNYPLNHFINSYHFELDSLFTEIQPLGDRQDVEDYIARLSQVDEQAEQLMEGLKRRESRGIIPPRFIVEQARGSVMHYLEMRSSDPAAIQPERLRVYTRFSEGLEALAELGAEEKEQFRRAARQEIEDSFIPAHLQLLDYLDYLQPLTNNDAGVWKLPDGDAYYAYLLRQETSTDLSPTEVHEIGLAEVARIQGEMRQALVELGYSQDLSFREMMDRAMTDGGFYDISTQGGQELYVAAIEALIAEADRQTAEAFDLRPGGEVIVIGGPAGGYYVAGAPDGSRPGSFHVSLAGHWQPKYALPTVAYHETIPGHHFQISIAQTLDLPRFRSALGFNAFVEGWAMYAERLAWELGLYDDDPYGNIGRLQYELLRAVRLVTDTGIHAMGWTRQQAQAYMDEAMGSQSGQFSHEVDRYVVMPAQATGYKVGMLKILELRQRAMDRLGDQFDIREFHNVVLGSGSVPLELLERLVDGYIEAKLAGG